MVNIESSLTPPFGDTGPRFRPAVSGMSRYAPGRPSALEHVRGFAQLASNELPFGPLPSVRQAIEQAISDVNRYPDLHASQLAAAIAGRHALDPAQVALGCGSIEVLRQAAMVTMEPGDEIICARPSFSEYSILACLLGANCLELPLLPDGAHDVEAMLDALGSSTRLVIICTPNNPTSGTTPKEALHWLVENLPSEILLVVDEAYQEFVDDTACTSAIDLLADHPNLLVLRTFSKAFGLAGLRVGYGVGSRELIETLGLARIPFGASSIAQAAALASLGAIEEMMVRVQEITAERKRMMDVLQGARVKVAPNPQGNFLWFPEPPMGVLELVEAVKASGALVRGVGNIGVRVTIGTSEENDKVLEACLSFSNWEEGDQG
jgi:histidinol-phosphate aminotransferase